MNSETALTGSQIAKSGFIAEEMMTKQEDIKSCFEMYFGKPITKIVKMDCRPHPKKSDIKFEFEDGTSDTAQVKNTAIKPNEQKKVAGRGWSVDRRDSDKICSGSLELTETLSSVCLGDKTKDRKTVGKSVSEMVLHQNILGCEESTKPNYFIKTESDRITGEIKHLGICPRDKFYGKLVENLYETVVSKKTCVHLSPNIYLQRKGGKKGEKRPNQIQTKMIFTPDIDEIFITIYQHPK